MQENWKCLDAGLPWQYGFEVSILTDARFTGQLASGIGPYKILNAVAREEFERSCAVFLRYNSHDVHVLGDHSVEDTSRYHGGGPADEIAALTSLALGVRFQVGPLLREWYDIGSPRPAEIKLDELNRIPERPRQRAVLPLCLQTRSLNDALIVFQAVRKLDGRKAAIVVKAARLYQQAIWLAENDPNTCFLMLVSAVECSANEWMGKTDPMANFMAAAPEELLRIHSQIAPEVADDLAKQLGKTLGATRGFRDFLQEWCPAPPEPRPPEFAALNWSHAKKAFMLVYKLRCDAVHNGTPIPYPMAMQLELGSKFYAEKPAGAAHAAMGATWTEKLVPMNLYCFEYIVRGALLNWIVAGAPLRADSVR